jgi:hypothetical protein
MPLSLTLASLWIVAASGVAMLPMRWQYRLGVPLLILVVPLLVFVGREAGWIWLAVLIAGLVSMFRRPLGAVARHIARRLGKGAA